VFIDEVLKFAFNSNRAIYTDMEVEYCVFGDKIIKPDYVVMRSVGEQEPQPLYVIEVKRTQGKQTQLLKELE
jgi:hypothetical protein